MVRQRKARKPKEMIEEVVRRAREGQSDSEIAGALHIHRTTVARYRARSEAEAVARMARVQVVQEALIKHFDDLGRLVERLKGEVSAPPPAQAAIEDLGQKGLHSLMHLDSGATTQWRTSEDGSVELCISAEGEMLFDPLKQHTKGSEVWRLFERWKELGGQYLVELSGFWRQVKKESCGDTGLDIVLQPDGPALTWYFPEVVYLDACQHAFSNGKGWEGIPYEVKTARPGRVELWQGNVMLAVCDAQGQAQRCAQVHEAMLKRYRPPEKGAQMLRSAVALLQELRGLEAAIRVELERVRLKRTFPGRCELCPD